MLQHSFLQCQQHQFQSYSKHSEQLATALLARQILCF